MNIRLDISQIVQIHMRASNSIGTNSAFGSIIFLASYPANAVHSHTAAWPGGPDN